LEQASRAHHPPPMTTEAQRQENAQILQACTKCLFEALPKMHEQELVDLLEFVAVQHSGNNFNPDNSAKALEICAFLSKRPFAATKVGVAALARLARHALGSGDEKSAEHKLWLLTSGALNTAAAICAYDGDAVVLFDAMQKDGGVRGRYLQRQYATKAMQEHVQDPGAYLEEEDPDELLMRKVSALRTSQLAVPVLLLLLAIAIAFVCGNETAQGAIVSRLEKWSGRSFSATAEDPLEL